MQISGRVSRSDKLISPRNWLDRCSWSSSRFRGASIPNRTEIADAFRPLSCSTSYAGRDWESHGPGRATHEPLSGALSSARPSCRRSRPSSHGASRGGAPRHAVPVRGRDAVAKAGRLIQRLALRLPYLPVVCAAAASGLASADPASSRRSGARKSELIRCWCNGR